MKIVRSGKPQLRDIDPKVFVGHSWTCSRCACVVVFEESDYESSPRKLFGLWTIGHDPAHVSVRPNHKHNSVSLLFRCPNCDRSVSETFYSYQLPMYSGDHNEELAQLIEEFGDDTEISKDTIKLAYSIFNAEGVRTMMHGRGIEIVEHEGWEQLQSLLADAYEGGIS